MKKEIIETDVGRFYFNEGGICSNKECDIEYNSDICLKRAKCAPCERADKKDGNYKKV